jgi:subtilisin family serine protease
MRTVGTDALARDSWIVALAPGADAAAEAAGLAHGAGGSVGSVYHYVLNGFQFRGSAEAAAALLHSPRVASVTADSPIFLTETLPYGIERVAAYGLGGVTGAYQAGFRGNGARIAILDTGIDLDHPELEDSIDNALGKNCITDGAAPNDGYGHGTHVSGTAAAPINGVGVAGIAPQARLVAVKMFTDSGSSSEAAALCALDHIVGLNSDSVSSNDVDVANMSWGEQRTWGDCAGDRLHGAICAAHAAGIILVAGAGNSAVNAGTFVPAAYPEVISVSALADFDGERGGLAGCGFVSDLFASECDDTFAFFSNYGASVDVIAPGVRIYSSYAGGTWRTSSGTSMATPHVAGIAALMAAAAPGLTPDDALAALVASGECPNGQAADADAVGGCAGQGAWAGDPDGTPEPMAHALRAAQRVSNPAVPLAPVLSFTASSSTVDLSWTVPSDGGASISGYEVYRGSTTGTATLLASVGSGETAYQDTAVASGETWFYQVAAVNSVGTGARSNEVQVLVPQPPPPPDPPSAPTLSATGGNTVVNLSWTAPTSDGGADVTGYEVYRGTASGDLALVATVGDILAYQDTGRTNGATYWYQVAALNAAGVGARSNEVSATPTAPISRPSAPRSLTAKVLGNAIRLTWQAPLSNGGSALTGYRLYRTDGSGGAVVFNLSPDSMTYADTRVTAGVWYAYVVSAVNSAGESQASNIVTVKAR